MVARLPGSEGRTLVPGDPGGAGPCKSPPPLQQNTQYRISIRHNTIAKVRVFLIGTPLRSGRVTNLKKNIFENLFIFVVNVCKAVLWYLNVIYRLAKLFKTCIISVDLETDFHSLMFTKFLPLPSSIYVYKE